MRYKRIVDLSQPIIHGGGFGRPAQITYFGHRSRGKVLADQLGIDPKDFDHKTNNMEEFSYLTTHTGTHFDSPWYYTETVQGEPALTIDQVPLEWCFGPGIWLDLSRKAPGR